MNVLSSIPFCGYVGGATTENLDLGCMIVVGLKRRDPFTIPPKKN
jgi:hypothetical protein